MCKIRPEPEPSAEPLASLLAALGCPAAKTPEMAAMLEKRARQLSAQKGCSHQEALTHLLSLLRQGWSAKEKGLS